MIERNAQMGYYLFAILDNVCCTLVLFAVGIFIIGICTGIAYSEKGDEQAASKAVIKSVIIALGIIFINTFIPNQKQMAFIISAPYIFENQDLKNASQNTSEIIKMGTEYLKDVLSEKTDKTKEK